MFTEELVSAVTRRRRIRAGHRGSLTRLINQVNEERLSANVGKLKQLRQSLLDKIETLTRLDDELLQMVDEDQLEVEIEESDVVKEKAQLAVIEIDGALASVKKNRSYSQLSSRTHSESSSRSSSPGEESGRPATLSYPSQVTDSPASTPCPTMRPKSPIHRPHCELSNVTSEAEPVNSTPVGGSAFQSRYCEGQLPPLSQLSEWNPFSVRGLQYTQATGEGVSVVSSRSNVLPVSSVLANQGLGVGTRRSVEPFAVPGQSGTGVPPLICNPPPLISVTCDAELLGPSKSSDVTWSSPGGVRFSLPPLIPSSSSEYNVWVPPLQTSYNVVTPTAPSIAFPTYRSSDVSHTALSQAYGATPVPQSTQAMTRLSSSPLVITPSIPVTTVATQVSVTGEHMSMSALNGTHATPLASGLTPCTQHSLAPQVKLPKLTMKKFGGDLTKWTTFWDSFHSSIHMNPSLSSIDKFNYLASLLESTAAEAIAGLSPSDANYDEAVATLKRRFGNSQLIIARHMDSLLTVSGVSSQHDVKGLRRFYDFIEAQVRGLKSLKVPAETYGTLLASILVNKIPPELRLILSREMTEESWDLMRLMSILEREINARERALPPLPASRKPQTRTPTAATLITQDHSSKTNQPSCVYCGQGHHSNSCTSLVEAAARKEALRKAGRCYVCLRRHHLSKDCRSTFNCRNCRGRHHISICSKVSKKAPAPTPPKDNQEPRDGTSSPSTGTPRGTKSLLADSQTSILLQTARLQLVNLSIDSLVESARAIMDSGSQRTYITDRLRQRLQLPTTSNETLRIETFGSEGADQNHCDVVCFGIQLEGGDVLTVSALVVPLICAPLTSQPINTSGEVHSHLLGLKLADSADVGDTLEVDVLVGLDLYWSLVTGEIIRGKDGPTAIHTKVGWILSGPTSRRTSVSLVASSTHSLKVGVCAVEPTLDDHLKRFWDLESIGISENESSVYEQFLQKISYDGSRYEVSLPWRECHPPLPDNFDLCRKRLVNLVKRLRQTPHLLKEYDRIIREQLEKGIVEKVPQTTEVKERVHYLPHHCVVRQDKSTSKIRIVYDASARSTGPSLNNCLYTGPKFCQLIFDILLRFRCHKVALIGDIEKAFLMVSIQKDDRDALRFLWTANLDSDEIELMPLRFTRVVFGVSASPFLLNATINQHLETFRKEDPEFVNRFQRSIYVDDLVSGGPDIETTHEFCLKARLRLATAGFNLRKFVSNSEELQLLIEESMCTEPDKSHVEESQSYAKLSLGVNLSEKTGSVRVLGVSWHSQRDMLEFDITEVAQTMESLEPTKRNLVRVTAKFFDPLGIVSPVTVLFKMFCQQICEAKLDWDTPLPNDQLTEWKRLLVVLREAKVISIPRSICPPFSFVSARLIGFCDASTKAYAAVVYIRFENSEDAQVSLLAAKTRVSPMQKVTVPRLELLSALLLSKLITSVQKAVEMEIPLERPLCFTDSKATMFWIKGVHNEWKQFVQNRVVAIRKLVPPELWWHCPGKDNPADIPSRGMSAAELAESSLWLRGPEWIRSPGNQGQGATDADVPEECRSELKHSDPMFSLSSVNTTTTAASVGQLISIKDFSDVRHLLRTTTVVLKFVNQLLSKACKRNLALVSKVTVTTNAFELARLLWIKDMQSHLTENKDFQSWKQKFGLFMDDQGIWKCGGRMTNSALPPSACNPILLDKDHHLAKLLVVEAHCRVMHNGVRETLSELRSRYWLIRGRQVVKKILYSCVTCRRFEGRSCGVQQPPPLPDFRVTQSRPFQSTGVDLAGPLYVKSCSASKTSKVWLVLFTCCTTRAIHLDLVQDMSTQAFLRSFRRFTSRRGTPTRMISDNAKTFKSAASLTLNSPEVKQFFGNLQMQWQFNLEKSPWQGGIFERMIQSAKRCLRKVIGKNCLTFDELLTLVTEVECVLNSRPLTYVYSDDVTEPLTPSHLINGFRLLSLPDLSTETDNEEGYTPEKVTRRASHLAETLEKFWKRWKREYLLELRNFHGDVSQKGTPHPLQVGEIVTVYDENHPRGMWRLGRIEELAPSADNIVRGVRVRTVSKSGRIKFIRRPIQHIFPLEVRAEVPPEEFSDYSGNDCDAAANEVNSTVRGRPKRQAAIHAQDKITGCLLDD